MGDRGFNAGGWAYMRRVWCPLCGLSYLTGNRNPSVYDRDTDRPKRVCSNKTKCELRKRKRTVGTQPTNEAKT